MSSKIGCSFTTAFCFAILSAALSQATADAQAPLGPGYAAWLAYGRVNAASVFGSESGIPDTVVTLGDDPLEQSSTHELAIGWRGMLGHVPRVIKSAQPVLNNPGESLVVVVGTQLAV